jgi:hypothetical protein
MLENFLYFELFNNVIGQQNQTAVTISFPFAKSAGVKWSSEITTAFCSATTIHIGRID